MLISEKLQKKEMFSKAESGVVDVISHLGESIEGVTVRQLAAKAYVSTSVVIHVCNKMGLDGYRDFVAAWMEEMRYLKNHFREVDANFPFTKQDPLRDVMTSIAKLYSETASDTLSMAKEADFQKAVRLLQKAVDIHVFCIGDFISYGQVFADRMMRIGRNVTVTDNMGRQFFFSGNMSEKDCDIVLTYTGTTEKTIEVMNHLYSHHVPVILIVGMGEQTIRKMSDVVLTLTTREHLSSNIGSFTSSVSASLLLDLLYACYFRSEYEKAMERRIAYTHEYEKNRKPASALMEQ